MPLRPCIECGKISQATRCPTCEAQRNKQRDAQRGTPTQRGLGATHRAQVRALKTATGPLTHCPRCGRPITPHNPITGQHTTARAHGGDEADSLICRSCNSSLGAQIRR